MKRLSFALLLSACAFVACKSEQEKKADAAEDKTLAWAKTVGFGDPVPASYLGTWKRGDGVRYVIKNQGDSTVQILYSKDSSFDERMGCGNCSQIQRLFYSASKDSIYAPVIHPVYLLGKSEAIKRYTSHYKKEGDNLLITNENFMNGSETLTPSED